MANSPLDAAREVADTMDRAARALKQATKESLSDAGTVAKGELTARAGEVPGGDRRFSRMRRYNHGGLLNVRTKIIGPTDLLVSPRGPWKLAETGADPHRLGRRGGWHPGTSQGRRSWTRGQADVYDKLGRQVPEHIGDAVEEAFRG